MRLKTDGEKKRKISMPLSFKLFLPLIVLSFLQMGVFFIALALSGEFSYIQSYAYNIFSEKTENRKEYVEGMLNGKVTSLEDTVNNLTEEIDAYLEETEHTAGDISKDKALNKDILRLSSVSLIELLRKSTVNDVYIILNSGEMYDQNGQKKESCLYFRDLDINSADRQNNTDIYVEVGSSDIARSLGITLDSEWSAHLEESKIQDDDLSFYYETVATAEQYGDKDLSLLGHWTAFTSITPLGQPSMKYTLPLRSSDGEVYGVLGIGVLQKTILSEIPSNDFFNESASYILAEDHDNTGVYTPLLHTGAVYNRLVTEGTVISQENVISSGIYNFNGEVQSGVDVIGCIKPMQLYNIGSPYLSDSWALVSVADESRVLSIYTTILSMMMVSTALSIVISLIFAIVISKRVTIPVKKIAKLVEEKMSDNSLLEFDISGISEIDRLSASISKLQVSVKNQASRVSKIISMSEMGLGVFMYDTRDKSVFLGESLIKLLEVQDLAIEDTVITAGEFLEIVKAVDNEHQIDDGFLSRLRCMRDGAASVELYSGSLNRWFRCQIVAGQDNLIGLVTDVTNTVIEKKKMEYERDYDVTTGLLNRRAYLTKLGELFTEPEQLGVAAVLMFDLDNLKYVNDTYGHDFGDDYIKTAANVLKSFRDYDGLTARLSGDEFNIFLYGFRTKEEVRAIVEKVVGELESSYCILADGTHYKVRASGGIAWYPDDSESYETLLKYADFAMYSIKHTTKGKIAEFDLSAYNKDSILLTGVEEMNRIIDEESLRYAFQPIISAKTGELYGYEALMRPQSDIFRSPLDFIRIAKTGAKLYEIERLTWKLALCDFKALCDDGTIQPTAHIFINSISDCKMKIEDVERIEQAYKECGLLKNIVLEVLEGEQADESFMQAKQKRMSDWGAMVALDDFGCGYNNEYALITLNPNLIKIDHSIISGCDRDISRQNIICNLVSHAKTHNILVLAEGVETSKELKTVIQCGVDYIQGYYVARPLFRPEPVSEKIKEEIRGYQGLKPNRRCFSKFRKRID